MKQLKGYTTKEKVEIYEAIAPLLEAMFTEFKEFSKRKPEGVVNKNKIKIVNRLLVKFKDVLQDEVAIKYLDLIDDDDVPQNSDIVLMLSQYNAAMEQYLEMYTDSITGAWKME
jgi:hypothetical protein